MDQIQFLIEEILKEKSGEHAFTLNLALANFLQELGFGPSVADAVIDKLYLLKSTHKLPKKEHFDGSPTYHLVGVACKCAKRWHVSELCKMLFWETEGLLLSGDPSMRNCIFKSIEKNGGPENIQALRDYIFDEKRSRPTTSHLMPRCEIELLDNVNRAIMACASRQ